MTTSEERPYLGHPLIDPSNPDAPEYVVIAVDALRTITERDLTRSTWDVLDTAVPVEQVVHHDWQGRENADPCWREVQS